MTADALIVLTPDAMPVPNGDLGAPAPVPE